jgi:hypothetical protein
MRQRLLQLLQLPRRAVHFHADQVGNLERFREQRADVLQMREQPFRIRVGFATENFIAVNGEFIKKVFLLARGSRNEPRKRRRENLQLSRMNFEIRMQTDEVRERLYSRNLYRSATRRAIVTSLWIHPTIFWTTTLPEFISTLSTAPTPRAPSSTALAFPVSAAPRSLSPSGGQGRLHWPVRGKKPDAERPMTTRNENIRDVALFIKMNH